ncbi:unnamed protein product [Coregonus sp. 'balchen']|nr:unnamed protein product [Coregonus sp. 'balchen']
MSTTDVPLQTTRPSCRVSSVSLNWSSGSRKYSMVLSNISGGDQLWEEVVVEMVARQLGESDLQFEGVEERGEGGGGCQAAGHWDNSSLDGLSEQFGRSMGNAKRLTLMTRK